jgi:hypothetical protein
MGSWSSSSMILVGLLVLALFEEDEGGQQGGGIEERFLYGRGIVVVSYDMPRMVFVCGVLLLFLA